MNRWTTPLAAATLLLLLTVSFNSSANDRKFAYTYETAVLPQGARELELSTTFRNKRHGFYRALDHRLELEIGITDRLLTALYVNFSGQATDDESGQRVSEFEYEGVSSEWKLKLTDPVADALGTGVYGELTVAPTETELELKGLFDKQLGDVLVAFNATGEFGWEHQPGGSEMELLLEPTLGASYAITPGFGAGVEVQNRMVLADGELEHATLFAGPVVSYAAPSWWATLSAMPQLIDLQSSTLNLDSNERLELRLLVASHL
jgi:hypothetical protein